MLRAITENLSGKKSGPDQRRKGFTLLEMVIAAGILGIALVVIIRGYVLTLRGLDYSAGRMGAFMLAENLLAEYELAGEFSPEQESGSAEGGFSWSRSVTPLAYEGVELPGIFRVEVTVSREGGVQVSLTTYVRN